MPGCSGTAWPGEAQHRGGHQVGATEGGDAQVGIRLGANRVVDLGDRLAGAELLDAQLRGHDVAVVAFCEGEEEVGVLGAGPAQGVLVGAVAAQRGATERRWEAVERRRREVQDEDLPAGAVQLVGQTGPDATTADDHGFHCCSSGIASRMIHTAQGEFFRM